MIHKAWKKNDELKLAAQITVNKREVRKNPLFKTKKNIQNFASFTVISAVYIEIVETCRFY